MTLENTFINFQSLFETQGQLLKIEKGHHIFREGDLANDIFLIQKGKVQISKEMENGKEITIRICKKECIIGECSLFNQSIPHFTSAIALTDCEVLNLSKNSLELLLTKQPSLIIEYLKWVQIENTKNQTLIRDLVMNGKKGALYSTLIRLANTYGEKNEEFQITINLNLNNSEIANLCATSREMVNRMLNDLKKQNIISINKGLITIHDLQFLKDECCCENCPDYICRID